MTNANASSRPSPENALFWAGERLDGQTIAFHIFSSPLSDRKNESRYPLLAAARTETACVVIQPPGLPRFILAHADRTFACVNAVRSHTLLDKLLQCDPEKTAATAWWHVARDARLHGCEFLAELVDRARGTAPRSNYEFVALADQQCQSAVPSLDEIEQDLLRAARESNDTLDPDLLDRVRCVINTIHSLYRTLAQEATFLIRERRIPIEVACRYGPLALGIQVQGAIALSSSKQGLRVDAECMPDVRSKLERCLGECEAVLKRDRELRPRFRVQRGKLIPHDGRHGRADAQLTDWIDSIVWDLIGPHGTPIAQPEGADGGTSSRSDEYRTHRRCSASIAAWTRMRAVARNVDLLEAIESGSSLEPVYSVTPRIESEPSQQRLAELVGMGFFVPAEGHEFALVRFIELELRALAECCAACGGELARIFHNEPDFVGYLVSQLNCRPTRLSSCHPGAEVDIVNAALEAISLRLGPAVACRLARVSFGVEIGEVEMQRLVDRLCELYPELDVYCNDDSIGVVATNLRADRDRIASHVGSSSSVKDFHREVYGLRAWTEDEATIAMLRHVNRNRDLDDLLKSSGGTARLYGALLRTHHQTPIGGVSGPAVFSEACAPHLDLADDAVKAALFDVVAAGYEIAAWANSTFAVEVCVERANDSQLEEIVKRAKDGAERVLREVPARIEGCLTNAW